MIPKKIHYCWFGKQAKPQLVQDCILSWEKYCPDFQIIEWNENNSDLSHPFVALAYKHRKWAFVSDYIRLKVLYEEGGIYLDTDMMLIHTLNQFLIHTCFLGAEEVSIVNLALFGCNKNHFFIRQLLNEYDIIDVSDTVDYNLITIPLLVTKQLENHIEKVPLEINTITYLNSIVIYPQDYFYPLPNKEKDNAVNYMSYVTSNTVAIHLWNASWVDYNEFDYLLKKEYLKALGIILNRVFIKRNINLYYFKRLYNHLKT